MDIASEMCCMNIKEVGRLLSLVKKKLDAWVSGLCVDLGYRPPGASAPAGTGNN